MKNTPQLQVTGRSGCVRLLTVADKEAVANTAAVDDDDKAQGALTALAAAVTTARPAFNFVLDVVYQPLQ